MNSKINKLLENINKSAECIFYADLNDKNIILLINNVIDAFNKFSKLMTPIPDYYFKLEKLIIDENNFTIPPLISLSDLTLFSSMISIPSSDEPKKIARVLHNLGNYFYL